MKNKLSISKIEKGDVLVMRCGGVLIADADASYSAMHFTAYYVPIKDSGTGLHITTYGKSLAKVSDGKRTPKNPFDIIKIIKGE